MLRGLIGPVAIAAGSQLVAAWLDHSFRTGAVLAGVGMAVFHVWRQNRYEAPAEWRHLTELQARQPPPGRMRGNGWPNDW